MTILALVCAMMNDFVAYASRPQILRMILIAAIFFVLGVWISGIVSPPPTSRRYSETLIVAAGWASMIFFGLCCIVLIKKLFDNEVQLYIGPTGIRWKSWSDQMIPWSEVDNVTVHSFKRQKFVVLHLRERKKYPGKGLLAAVSGPNRMLTRGDIHISLQGTDRSFADALAATERFWTSVR